MKFFSTFLVTTSLLAGVTCLPAADNQVVLPEDVLPGLKVILENAVTRSPRMIQRSLDVMVAEGDLMQAKAGRLPAVSGYYQVGKARDIREDEPGALDADKIAYNLVVSQPVFHWNERRNNARIGELRQHIARQQYDEAYRMLAHEIRSSYMQLILKKIQLAQVRLECQRSDRALTLAEERLAQKVISEAEIFQTRIANDRQRLALDQAALEFAQLKHTFAALTGTPQPADDAIPDGIGALASVQAGVSRMLADFLGHSEPAVAQVMIMRRHIEAEELTYQNHRTRLRPKFNLVAGITQDEQSYTRNIGLKYGLQSRYVGLQAVWSIFDGHAARGAATSSLARKRQLELGYRLLKENLAHEAQRAAQQVELAWRHLQINERLLENSLAALSYRREDLQRGLAAKSDVEAAEAGYNGVFAGTVAARSNYLVRVMEFVSLVGADPAVANLAAFNAQNQP